MRFRPLLARACARTPHLMLAAAGASCAGPDRVAPSVPPPAVSASPIASGSVATPGPTLPSSPSEGGAGIPPAPGERAPSFADDLAFLEQHGPIHLLESPNGGR